MTKRMRYWLWQTEEIVITTIGIAAAFSVVQLLLNGLEKPFQIIGVLLAAFFGVLLLFLNAQNIQFISISLLLGCTRRNSLLGLFFMHLCFFVQIELLQLLIYFLPFMDQRLQLGVLSYMPVIWLLIDGASYLLFIIQIKSEKIYAVINAVIYMCVGGVVGFVAVAPSVLAEFDITVVRNGQLFLILLAVGVVLYAAGAYIYIRNIQKLDARV